jgi:hypothetical protein
MVLALTYRNYRVNRTCGCSMELSYITSDPPNTILNKNN